MEGMLTFIPSFDNGEFDHPAHNFFVLSRECQSTSAMMAWWAIIKLTDTLTVSHLVDQYFSIRNG
jgi:hypothetical protein